SVAGLSPVTFSAHNHSTSELLRTLSMNGCFYANILVVCAVAHPFPLSPHLGTLAVGLGFFPLDYGAYPPQSDSHRTTNGIRSLKEFGNLSGPLARSVLYLR